MIGRRLLIACAAVSLGVTACSSASEAPAADPLPPRTGDVSGRVTVLAASSLTDVFAELADGFRADHPGVDVVLSFAGSSSLVSQVRQGAPADVLATASSATMRQVTDEGLSSGRPEPLARNVLEVVVPAGNPGGVEDIGDLADPDLSVALCAAQVPCGAAAQQVLENAGVEASPATLESDVRAVLTKVALGEVDAGLVYATDVRAGGDRVTGIPIPGAEQAATEYQVTVLEDAPNPVAARAFVAHVLSEEGRAAFDAAGFLPP